MIPDDESNVDPTDFFLYRGSHESETTRLFPNANRANPVAQSGHNFRDLVNAPFILVGNDQFFKHLYAYYQGSGLICIAMTQICYLLTVLFTILFSTFLMTCVDWKGIHENRKKNFHEAIYPMCRPDEGRNGLVTFAFCIFIIWWFVEVVRSCSYMVRIKRVHELWIELLHLSPDVRWVTWQMVIDSYHDNVDQTVDSYYIVNRIVRWDNYLIAMLTKDIFGWNTLSGVFTKVLEYNLEKSITGALFRDDGILIKDVMFQHRKREYVQKLQTSFYYYGILNLICMPFVFSALTVFFIYRYVSEYHKKPKAMGMYSFTPIAKWRLRDFNELPHVYTARLNRAHPTIIEYFGQFVNETYNIVFKFVSFILGSTMLILVGVSFFYPDVIISLFVTEQPVIFYVGVVGLLFAVVRNSTVDEPIVYEPDEKFDRLMKDLHGTPTTWNNMSTKERYFEIRRLFRYKWMIFLLEIASVIYVPFILLFWLPHQAENIVDFFRENSIYVDKMGIICSCANFDAQQPLMRASDDNDDDVCSVTSSMDMKTSTSMLNFKETYKTWDPERFKRNGTSSDLLNQEYKERQRASRLQRDHRERPQSPMPSMPSMPSIDSNSNSALTQELQRLRQEQLLNTSCETSPSGPSAISISSPTNCGGTSNQSHNSSLSNSLPFDLNLPFPLHLTEETNHEPETDQWK
jgi:autophagy-related protein 9